VLGAALYDPVWTTTVHSPRDFCIALVGFVLLVAWRGPPIVVVAFSAAAGTDGSAVTFDPAKSSRACRRWRCAHRHRGRRKCAFDDRDVLSDLSDRLLRINAGYAVQLPQQFPPMHQKGPQRATVA
jgi:hypothetical protein